MKTAISIAVVLAAVFGYGFFATPAAPGAPQLAGTVTLSPTVTDISSAEDAYFAKNGKYLEVIQGDQLPDGGKGTASSVLGVQIPPEMTIDIYEGPDGAGYKVTYKDATKKYSYGFGPEASKTTFVVDKNLDAPQNASTTP